MEPPLLDQQFSIVEFFITKLNVSGINDSIVIAPLITPNYLEIVSLVTDNVYLYVSLFYT